MLAQPVNAVKILAAHTQTHVLIQISLALIENEKRLARFVTTQLATINRDQRGCSNPKETNTHDRSLSLNSIILHSLSFCFADNLIIPFCKEVDSKTFLVWISRVHKVAQTIVEKKPIKYSLALNTSKVAASSSFPKMVSIQPWLGRIIISQLATIWRFARSSCLIVHFGFRMNTTLIDPRYFH